jgi:hypothetical protein
MLYIGLSNDVLNQQPIEINVVNMLGEVVASKKMLANSSTVSLALADLSNGLYVLEVKQNEKVSFKKFQVAH